MRYLNLIPIALVAAVSGVLSGDAVGQRGTAAPPQAIGSPLAPGTFPYRDAVNAGTVSIITAPAGGAKSVFAADMARVLDEKDKLRILPVLGKGPVQNVIDILYLKSIDMGLVTTDVPEFYKIEYNVANITDRLRYIMKLYNDEIHIIAPTEIKTVFDLEGKRIEAPKDVGLYSAKAIFSRLKINVTFDSSYLNDDTGALQQVVDGKADAWIVGTGKVMPVEPVLRSLKPLPPRYDRSNAGLLPFRMARRFGEFVNPGKQCIHEFRDSLVPFSPFRKI